VKLTLVLLLSLAVGSASVGAELALPREDSPPLDDLSLRSAETVPYAAFSAHVRSGNPEIDEIYLRTLYRHYREICRVEGINLLSALAQMIHETGYLRFNGSVRAVQYNYAGIGAVAAGHPGDTFPDMRTGVAAHVQHMKAYASTDPLETVLVDPRFHLVVRGSARTVRSLTGRWATDPDYGTKVLAHVSAMRVHAQNLRE